MKNVLILSGGGIGGVISARCLEKYVKDVKFDLISATSVGSILGAYLALGNSTENLEKIFVEAAYRIFGKKKLLPPLYDVNAATNIINTVLGGAKVKHCKTPLMISTTDLVSNETLFFNSDSDKVDGNQQLAEFIKPSFSAPLYFETTNIKELLRILSDGGVGYYNFPCMQTFVEMLKRRMLDDQNVVIWMFGTGLLETTPEQKEREYNALSKSSWFHAVKEYMSPVDGGFARKASYIENISTAMSLGNHMDNVTVKYYDCKIKKPYKLDSLKDMEKLTQLDISSWVW